MILAINLCKLLPHGAIMETVSGKHVGTTIFVYEGYTYHMDNRCKGIYRSSSRRNINCDAVFLRNPDEMYIVKLPHNHSVNDTILLQQIEMKQDVLRMCRETLMNPKEIFDTVCRS